MSKLLYVKGSSMVQEFAVVEETTDNYVVNRFGHKAIINKNTMTSESTGGRVWSVKQDMASQTIESLEELIQSIKFKRNGESGQRDIAVIYSRLKESGIV